MIIYLTLTSILIFIFSVVYFSVFRRFMSVWHRKLTIVIGLILSLTTPFFTPELPNYSTLKNQGKIFYSEYTELNLAKIDDERLIECYNSFYKKGQSCNCESIVESSSFSLKNIPAYNYFLKYKVILFILFISISSFWLFSLLINFSRLLLLIHFSDSKLIQFQGKSVYFLQPKFFYAGQPSAFKLWNSYILWSESLEYLDEQEKTAITAHEFAHLRQNDTWANIFFQALKILWWFNPLVYLLEREYLKLSEFNADDYASQFTNSRAQYAGLLIKVQELCFHNSQTYSLAFNFSESLFGMRVKRMIKPKSENSSDAPERKLFFVSNFLSCIVFFVLSLWILPEFQKQELKLKQYEILLSENFFSKNQECGS